MMWTLYIIALTSSLPYVLGKTQVEAKQGSTAVLKFNTNIENANEISCSRGNTQIYTKNQNASSFMGDLVNRTTDQIAGQLLTLSIKNVRKSDAADYKCHFTASTTSQTNSTEITLLVKGNNPKKGMSIGIIVGIAVAALVIIAIVIAAVLVFKRKKRGFKPVKTSDDAETGEDKKAKGKKKETPLEEKPKIENVEDKSSKPEDAQGDPKGTGEIKDTEDISKPVPATDGK